MFELSYADFETENLISHTKFRLTEWTLNQYKTFTEVLVRILKVLMTSDLREKMSGKEVLILDDNSRY